MTQARLPPRLAHRARVHVLGSALLCLLGCGTRKPPPAAPIPDQATAKPTSAIPVRVSSDLADAAQQLDHRFKGGAYELSIDSGRAVHTAETCRAVVALLSDPTLEVAGTQNDYSAFWAEAARCAALAYMERARPARTSLIRPLLTSDPRSWLPPELTLLEDLRELAQVRAEGERCQSWGQREPNLVTKSAGEQGATLANGTWTAELSYWALADFTADGFEDLLVRRDATVDEGSYGDSILLLLSRTDQDTCVRVLERAGPSPQVR